MPVFAITLTHREGSGSPHSHEARSLLKSAHLDLGPVEASVCYLIEGTFNSARAYDAAELLCDPVLEHPAISLGEITDASRGTQILVMRKPGVMDPVEASVLATLNNGGIEASAAKCARIYHFEAELTAQQLASAVRTLSNEAVEAFHVGAFALTSLVLGNDYTFKLEHVPLRELDAAGLAKLNTTWGLSMNQAELAAVQAFFRQAEREPTDIELEMIAQTWSEHCKHKTLTGPVTYQEESDIDALRDLCPAVVPAQGPIAGLLQSTIKRATEELDRSFCWSVFVDNAGVIDFDGEDGICVKVETHNHPSAIEPYGGAGTGIGGVIRDILGTGLGARPIMNTDVFCVGHPDMPADDVPRGALHPLRTLRGVVAGVRDYGNRMGIPTANGAICFDERYTGNPLVYAGCIGILPKDKVAKKANPGDKIVAVGGRTGRDGIGGATFSSVELTEKSETVSAGAVQIGNAIQEKVVLDTLLQARDLNLYTCVTVCGAGGFSSAVGEMGELTGARVELRQAPLKYEGLSYREIWISEAQERMVFAVPPGNLDEFLSVFAAEDVEAAVLGEFTDDGQMVVNYGGKEVLNLPMSFLHDGLPKVERSATWQGRGSIRHHEATVQQLAIAMSAQTSVAGRNGQILKAILRSPNVASKEVIIRQYDHEVQAASAVKPLCGTYRDGPSDAAAIVPKTGSSKALVVGCGINPHFGDVDPYWMALSVIDEAVRNVVATGGNIDHTAILDNFSWGNCNKPDRMGGMVRACVGCYVAAKGLGTPFISGKDSLNNEFATEEGTIAIPPTLLVTAVSVTEIKHLTTMDVKEVGNSLWQVGLTKREFGASHFDLVTGESSSEIPSYDPAAALALYRAVNQAQAAGIVRAAHDLSEGGLAACLAEMAFAGNLGLRVTLVQELADAESGVDDQTLLFAESNARLVLEVARGKEEELRSIFAGLPCTLLGEVVGERRIEITGLSGEVVLSEDLEDLRNTWKQPLYAALGEEVPSLVGA